MAQTTVDGSFITLNTIDGTKLALASQAAGDIMYYNGTDWVRVGIGTDGQVLTVNNAENAPGWEAASAGATLSGSTNNTVVTVTGANAMIGETGLTYSGTAMLVALAGSPPTPDHVSMHIWEGNAGSTTASTDTQFIIEHSGNAGMTILTPANATAQISFGSPTDNRQGSIYYDHATDKMYFRTAQNNQMSIDGTGAVTMPSQPCVTAKNNSNDNDVTGNGTYFTVDFDSELFDQGSDFASDTFTASVTGRYAVNVKVALGHITTSATACYVFFTTSNRAWTAVEINPGDTQTSNQLGVAASAIIDMDAADTLYIRCFVSGISQVVDCLGGGSDPATWISVTLAA